MSALEIATPDHIPAIMAIERTEGYEGWVGRWSAEEHRAEFDRAESRYLVVRDADRILGFAILQDLGNPSRCTMLRRVAVAEPGRGTGRALVRLVVDHVFDATPTHRLQLRVFVDNERALRAYAAVGFVAEGILRDIAPRPDGSFRSMWLMSVLRTEWPGRERDA